MAVFSGNGAAATPSFTFSADTNLGIYRGGTDILSITTDGTERARFDAVGAFEIGGTLGVAANIILNADGSATYGGNVTLPGGGAATDALQAQEISNLITTAVGSYVPLAGGTMTGQLTLPGGGSATQALQSQEITALIAAGANLEAVTTAGNTSTNDILIGGTLPATPNISLNADGTSGFSNFMTVQNGITVNRSAGNSARLGTANSALALKEAGLYATDGVLGEIWLYTSGEASFSSDVLIGGTIPSSPNIELNASGIGTFQSSVFGRTIYGINPSTNSDASSFEIYEASVGSQTSADLRARWRNNGDLYIGGTLTGATPVPNISLNADGSARYLGRIEVGDFSTDGLYLNANGAIQVVRSADDRAALLVNVGTTRTFDCISDGTVRIGGNISGLPGTDSPNIQLNPDGTIVAVADATIHGVTVGLGGGSVSINTAVGNNALSDNTSGSACVAVGANALFKNTTGIWNTALGRSALRSNEIGQYNTAVGHSSLLDNVDGSYNTAIGLQSCWQNTSGNYNTALGYDALRNGTTGSGNVVLGSRSAAGVYGPVSDITTENDRIVMGHTSVTNAYVKVAWTVTSDARDKTNFAPVPHGLDFVKQLEPTQYEFRVDRDSEEVNGPVRYGFKAQDILALEGDNPVIIDTEDEDNLKLNTDAIVPVLVNAIKEQQSVIETLVARLDSAGL